MSAHPAPPPAQPVSVAEKPRPSGWWFVVGAGLIVVGIVIAVVLIVSVAKDFSHIDATVEADGTAQQVSVDPSKTYLVWDSVADRDDCTVSDGQGALSLEGLGSSSYSKSGGSGSWTGVGLLHPRTTELDVTCASSGGPVQIGEKPNIGGFVGGILGGVGAAIVLGLAGLVVLIVTTVLFVTRPSRRSLAG